MDYDAGTIYGLMEAMDVPMSASNVVTFWEGEIIDFENHTLWTKKWAAKARTDLDHWKRLEAFQGIDEKYIVKGAKTGKFRGHIDQKYIFMRWKGTPTWIHLSLSSFHPPPPSVPPLRNAHDKGEEEGILTTSGGGCSCNCLNVSLEKHFVNASEHTSRLTIAGFYYVSMRRSDGYVEGYYHDQHSAPYQHLCLSPIYDSGGFSSSIFEVA